MILNTTTKTLEVSLGEAIATTEASITASFGDYTQTGFLPGGSDAATNGVTAVTAVAAPGSGTQRAVQELRVVNLDTIAHNVRVTLNDNGTLRRVQQQLVGPGGNFLYAPSVVPTDQRIVSSASVASGAAIALTTGTAKDVTTLSLGAGSWLLFGAVCFSGAGATTVTRVAGSISDTLDTMAAGPGEFGNQYLAGATVTTIGQDVVVGGLLAQVSLAATTTLHLVADAAFGVSTLSAYGTLVAVPAA